jgi:glycosyltransferase involved in cell wall biosynthesis
VKVLFAITKSEHGGAQTHVWQLSLHLLRSGHSPHITAHPGGWLEDQARQNNVPFHPNAALSNSPNPLRGWQAASEIARLVRKIDPDVVHCHSSAAGLWSRLGIAGAVPTVFTAHGWGFGAGAPWLRRVALRLSERAVARFTDKIICVSDYDRQLAAQCGIAPSEKMTVIHNGVESRLVETGKRSAQSRIRAVFVGRLARPKEPELLLAALSELPARLRDDYELTVVGGGPLLPRLRAQVARVKSHVRFTGDLPRDEVLNLLNESQVLVLMSRHEGLPMSILEAMSMGLAVIASDVGGVREAVTPDCGILIARGDKQALKHALARLVEDRAAIERFGAAAELRARSEFSLTSMCASTMAVYESVRAR